MFVYVLLRHRQSCQPQTECNWVTVTCRCQVSLYVAVMYCQLLLRLQRLHCSYTLQGAQKHVHSCSCLTMLLSFERQLGALTVGTSMTNLC